MTATGFADRGACPDDFALVSRLPNFLLDRKNRGAVLRQMAALARR